MCTDYYSIYKANVAIYKVLHGLVDLHEDCGDTVVAARERS